jgi:putative protein kinase ArgK-like GTPase of G3E family
VFAVHKWDLGAPAQRTRADLEAMLPAIGQEQSGWERPVIGTSSQNGEGVAELCALLAQHRDHLAASGERERRRSAGRAAWAIEQIQARFGSLGLERLGGRAAALELCAATPGTLLDALARLTDELER